MIQCHVPFETQDKLKFLKIKYLVPLESGDFKLLLNTKIRVCSHRAHLVPGLGLYHTLRPLHPHPVNTKYVICSLDPSLGCCLGHRMWY